ncbi:sensor histidine kinase [Candidatus Cyanaurora vandensis]|uniref:sensor histidine kinase n=1 Tax=Candidatus Cyanaurora vandensis TaxID=2714958 RepID=UPI00257EC9B9|nr:sensor histidine kinase [Candidatus Cyanaurora vandensis]
MPINDVDKLAVLIKQERDALLSRWRQQVKELPAARDLDAPTLNDHLPDLIDELAAALQVRSDETIPEALAERSPPAHGLQRIQDGFDIEEVVAEYNILRGCIHDLADANGLRLQGKSFHILNRVLDGAIGLAVQTYATQQAKDVQQRREEYLAFVAHDLRNPLNAISLATSILERKLPERGASAESVQMLKTLRRNVAHLDGLIGKVIEENTHLLSQTGIKLERRVLDLWPLVEALIQDVHPVAGTASTQMLNEVPGDLVVYADASALRRVFQNLIANAILYTPGGEVIIGARELDAKGAVEGWVSDNGAGIPQERLDKVFDKLETDPQKEGGLGLGLAIVKTFIEAHDGKVAVESKEGLGSKFRFTLPAGKAAIDSGGS